MLLGPPLAIISLSCIPGKWEGKNFAIQAISEGTSAPSELSWEVIPWTLPPQREVVGGGEVWCGECALGYFLATITHFVTFLAFSTPL